MNSIIYSCLLKIMKVQYMQMHGDARRSAIL